MSTLAFAASSSAPALAATAQRAPADTFQGASLRSAAVPEAAAAAGPASGVFEAALPLGLAGVGAVVLAGRSAKRATRSPLASAVALKAFENELGVQPPTGFWDPAGFCSDGDAKEFYRRRCVEIKHGRVSMLACLGYIVPEYFKFPGYLSATSGIKFADVGTGLSALLKVPAVGWFQWVFFCGYMELFACYQDPDLMPGKLSSRFVVGLTTIKSDTLSGWVFGPFGVPNAPSIADPELRKKKLNAEIANGRLAMMAIIGMFFQDGLTGSAWGDWALYTDSPLRAYENEAGVQAPVGFWDPLGLSASGSAFDFKRRREVELKHGRVCMFATIGYMVPEYTRLPGFLSPSYGVQFTDVPNGLSALSKVPALGWCQIVAFAGLIELNVYNEQINGEPGNYGAGFLGIRSIGLMSPGFKDPETRKKKLNAELANGRLAMMAIIGMFFQDGLTGSAWGDWALYTESPLRAFEAELGVQAPTGFWDPVGFTKDGDVEKFKRRRVTEIKHGRVAMLATMGYITPELTGKFPGYLSPAAGLKFEDIPNGLAAISKVPGAGWVQIVLYALFCESTGGFGYNSDGQKSDPGNCGWKPPLLATEDKDLRRKRLNAELANGRLAMMAIIGMFFQDGLTGSAWGDWALYTESPLRAFESELGVQAPLGFWDPIGYTADGSVENFKRRRQTELKHGRISMLATMGYITPELTGKFPGYLSPSMGLKFADIPNGLAALSKVPAIGWAQIIGYMSFCEISADQSPGTPGADGDFGFKVLTASDPAAKTRKLNAELANGRLAMMAIMGMFFQDGLTGSAWGDWALYTDSPLRAFENELGVQPPVGFWDPLEFTKDGSRENFLRRRAVEIKHGRVAMYACIGYFVPEYTKFSGDLSPSLGIKFSDVPNGLGAFSTVPLAGWLQIVAFCGFIENTGFTFSQRKKIGWMLDASMTSEKAEPGNYGLGWIGAFNTLKPIPALRQRKLNAELANGRLAMVAILAMFFQNGTFGTTGPEMWAIELPEYANTVGDFIPKNLA